MNSIRAAAIQFNHKPGDKAHNLGQIEQLAASAAQQDVQIAAFPEMCITGYWHVRNLSRDQIEGLAEPFQTGPSSKRLLELSAALEMTIGAGLIERDQDGELFNTYLVAMPNGELKRHRKLHCFISEHMSSGDQYTVFDTPHGVRVGVLICYDNNIGENVRMTALAGAQVLLAPHQTGGCNSPSPRCMGVIDPMIWHDRIENPAVIEKEILGPKGRAWLMRWLPARAHDNGMFLVFSNGVGVDDNEVRTGNSMILDAYGEVLAETASPESAVVVADLDLSMLASCTGRRWLRSRRPELYDPLAKPTGIEQDTRIVRFTPVEADGITE